MNNNIIIIGGNAAGPAAAASAKRENPNANVILFEATEFISTGTCEMPFVISKKIENYKKIVFFDSESFFQSKGVQVYTNHFVEEIKRKEKKIVVRNIKSHDLLEFDYDKLVLATGSVAKKLPILAKGYSNLFYLKNIPDLIKILDFTEENDLNSVLILGSGFVGLEVAEAFSEIEKNVTIIDIESQPFPGAEPEIRELIAEELKGNGVQFIGGIPYQFIFSNERITAIKVDGRILEFDIVISVIGVKPNVQLAENIGLEIGKFGGLKVDKKQKTSDSNIYAAGDNTEIINSVTGKSDYLPLATIAYSQSHVSGTNSAGGNKYSDSVVKNIVVKVFSKTYVSVGISEEQAKEFFPSKKSVSALGFSKIKVMKDSEKIFGKLVFEKSSKRILGASFWGANQAAGYGDLLSALIKIKADFRILENVNFNYTPPISPFINLLNILGKKANELQ